MARFTATVLALLVLLVGSSSAAPDYSPLALGDTALADVTPRTPVHLYAVVPTPSVASPGFHLEVYVTETNSTESYAGMMIAAAVTLDVHEPATPPSTDSFTHAYEALVDNMVFVQLGEAEVQTCIENGRTGTSGPMANQTTCRIYVAIQAVGMTPESPSVSTMTQVANGPVPTWMYSASTSLNGYLSPSLHNGAAGLIQEVTPGSVKLSPSIMGAGTFYLGVGAVASALENTQIVYFAQQTDGTFEANVDIDCSADQQDASGNCFVTYYYYDAADAPVGKLEVSRCMSDSRDSCVAPWNGDSSLECQALHQIYYCNVINHCDVNENGVSIDTACHNAAADAECVDDNICSTLSPSSYAGGSGSGSYFPYGGSGSGYSPISPGDLPEGCDLAGVVACAQDAEAKGEPSDLDQACDMLHDMVKCVNKASCYNDEIETYCKTAVEEQGCPASTCEVGGAVGTTELIAIIAGAVCGTAILAGMAVFFVRRHRQNTAAAAAHASGYSVNYAPMGDDAAAPVAPPQA